MEKPSVKKVITNNKVYFHYYRHQHMYYMVVVDEVKYSFPVPLDDVQDATLHKIEKAILFMRYIRKALDEGTFVKITE